jgi:SAM-dependent methyltransferase
MAVLEPIPTLAGVPEQAKTSEYRGKPEDYFSGARKAFVDDLPPNPTGRLLEIGCGNGDTAAYALKMGKCGTSIGVELCSEPAEDAATKLQQVFVGDIECLTLPFPPNHFDVVIMSEVIEHLRNPWETLEKMSSLMKPGGIILAGSPNAAHHSVVRSLLRGRWDYTDSGVMDRTHLRWFTASTYRELFETCGFTVEYVRPVFWSAKAEKVNRLTRGKFQHLLHNQMYVRARK